MRILLCSPLRSVGGIAQWTRNILDVSERMGAKNVHLVHYYPPTKIGAAWGNSFFPRVIRGIVQYVPMCFQISNKIINESIDVLHLCSSASFGLLKDYFVLKKSQKLKIKTVIHFHFGRIPVVFSKNNWECRLIKKVIHLSNKCIVIDHASYNTLVDYGFSNIEYLPNPYSLELDSIIKKNSFLKRKPNKVVFVGHVIRTKGVLELVQACSKLRDVHLYLVGEVNDEMKSLIYKQVKGRSHEFIHLTGEVDYETAINHILTASVFVLPSYTEGFPNVIIESMACSCPIVATNVGAIPEMLGISQEPRCGICVPLGDVKELEIAINQMLNDITFAENCGSNAKNRVVREYSINKIWCSLNKIWSSI